MKVITQLSFPELESFPIRCGLFPKQFTEKGECCAPENKEICHALRGRSYCDLRQVHSTTVRPVTLQSASKCPGDGLCTHTPLLSLHIRHSDCQPAIFYDPDKHVIANVHAGWRGLLGNIYAVTISLLKKRYRSRPQDLIVSIGPSIGPVHAVYPDYKRLFPSSFIALMPEENHMDFRAVARQQLLEMGVRTSNLFISDLCTYAEHETLFSSRYRNTHADPREIGSQAKNNVTAVMLCPRE